MHIDELVIEITRRCNMACPHCLRGNAQDKDIDNVTVDKILDGVSFIGTLTFTGGEPSLAVDRIRYITERIKARGIPVGNFYVVTNGKVASLDLVHALLDLYALLEYPDEVITTLTISKDQYHDIDTSEAHKLYKCLRFYDPEHRKESLKILINEGRAYENGKGGRDAYISPLCLEVDAEGNPEHVEGTVYVNALGDVVPSCDMSYESQEQSKIGNVHEKSLTDILVATVSST